MAIATCTQRYANKCDIRKPTEGHVLSGWVRITFENGGSVITVGNQSAPISGNTAVIKSFEFGSADGFRAKIVIHDQEGSNFVTFMENVLRDLACTVENAATTVLRVEFGWVKNICQGNAPIDDSCQYFMNPHEVETNFAEGKFMYTITCLDLGHAMIENSGKYDKIRGYDGGGEEYLTDAITNLLTDKRVPPAVESVRFLRRTNKNSPPEKVKFKDYDDDPYKGPKMKWTGNLRDKLNTAKDWISAYVTDREKSWVPSYNSCGIKGGEIIFWEDSKPKPNEVVENWAENCIGTYIVNGGKDSSVIDFSPSIKSNFAALGIAGGNAGDRSVDGGNDQGKNPGNANSNTFTRSNECYRRAGSETSSSADSNWSDRAPKEANRKTAIAQAEQLRALKLNYEAMQADLVIIGDATLIPNEVVNNRTVSIVFINPFHLMSTGEDGSCGEWLATHVCNDVISNRGWLINSVTHRIDGGKFTTTLGIHLAIPGTDIDLGKPFGSDPMGWRPNLYCVCNSGERQGTQL